ncbi:EamA family transporter [Desertivirga xinjiangensis]|uniref:EamA family transporter n=1 Tax=Desertivirga xinjiangensis TaxID=539206 RepID=UPI00210DAD52|nr:EamA family transporter [Pedobacter xinjiangensis]
MERSKVKDATPLMVIVAFVTVYLVWGSTYFFIQKAIHGFPPFFLGAFRFSTAGLIMLAWCTYKQQKVFVWSQIKHSLVSGFLLLFIGNGAVIWVEQFLPSALVAILVSSAPLWFVLLDIPKWRENLNSRSTVFGLLVGFVGVIILFYKNMLDAFSTGGSTLEMGGMALLIIGAMSWAGGSLYSKYKSSGAATVNSAWQMIAASVAFTISSVISNEPEGFNWSSVPSEAWWSIGYLVIFGSIAGFSAYVWLLEVRPATQVSTYAYVNPVVAVLLGVFFANESITLLQILGLIIILLSVLMINLAKYRAVKYK